MVIATILARKGVKIVTIRPEQTLREALAMLAQHSIGAVLVTDARGALVGILSERDIVRVAVIGAGPTGVYAADQLLRQAGLVVEIDLFDRVPMPFGLVRSGVAPDHQKIKSVTVTFDKIASDPRVRFYGCVELGKHVTV